MNKKMILLTSISLLLLQAPMMNPVEASTTEQSIMKQSEDQNNISAEKVITLASRYAEVASYIQSGGNYQEDDYQTFNHNNKTYRYLSKDIDTKIEILRYLNKTFTLKASLDFIKQREIIKHNGRLAQLEADGGSLLNWQEAKTEFIKTKNNITFYRVIVPIGETEEKAMYIASFKYQPKKGWRLADEPYLDLDIPFNINPAYLFFHNLLLNTENAQEQIIDENVLHAASFKKGIKKVEVRSLEEVSKSEAQVEFSCEFYVELEKGYKGNLKQGTNKLYFLIQQTNEHEFKIVSYSKERQLNQ